MERSTFSLKPKAILTNWKPRLHSPKIPTIQQGRPRGVSSVGNPRQASTGFTSRRLAELVQLLHAGFYSGRVATVHLLYLLDIPCEVCKVLTKC